MMRNCFDQQTTTIAYSIVLRVSDERLLSFDTGIHKSHENVTKFECLIPILPIAFAASSMSLWCSSTIFRVVSSSKISNAAETRNIPT